MSFLLRETMDTIAAIASASGTSAVSLIRISGPQAFEIAEKACGSLPRARTIGLRTIRNEDGTAIDDGVLTVFAGPASYTGEDTVEFAGHGGVVVTRKVLECFLLLGARAAEPGEFTQRAFLNGKMDLTQAEAVMDLISAQTGLALRSAKEQLDGRLGQRCEAIRAALLSATAHLEAYIDFPEEDIDPQVGKSLQLDLQHQMNEIDQLLATADQGRLLREGVRTVIYGKPNVGKSSLLNRLLGYQRAIVNEREGTTRDVIEEVINIRGIPLRMIDTAGVRVSDDEIEQEGIAMTQQQLERADLILQVTDLSDPPQAALPVPDGVTTLQLFNKIDELHPDWSPLSLQKGITISCKTGEGFTDLEEELARVLSLDQEHWSSQSVAVNARHQGCLNRARLALQAAITSLAAGEEPELTALSLREALASIGEISGIVETEEILGEIFGNFCIGK